MVAKKEILPAVVKKERQLDLFVKIDFLNHTVPQMLEIRKKDYIFYGEDNNYPDYLLKLFNRSGKHNAIITGKKEYVVGKGWHVDENATDPKGIAKKWIERANPQETLNDILEKVALDLEIFGGFALQIIYTKGSGYTNGAVPQIAEIWHIDFSKIRAGKYLGQDVEQINGEPFVYDYYFSNKWTAWDNQQSLERTGFKGFKAYNPDDPTGTQLLYFKEYRPKTEVYPLPDYIGCISDIETDYEISNFHFHGIKNRFTPSYWINFNNGIPKTEEEMDNLERRITNKFTGTDNTNRMMLNWSESPETKPDITPMTPVDMDKQYIALDESIQQRIFTGHKITNPSLFGVITTTVLGNKGEELVQSEELFQNGYVAHKQQLIANVFNQLLIDMGVQGKPLSIQKTRRAALQMTSVIAAANMTQDEVRLAIGLPALNIKGVTDVLPPIAAPTVAPTKLSKQHFETDKKKQQDFVLSLFAKIGTPKKDCHIIQTRRVLFSKEDNDVYEPSLENEYAFQNKLQEWENRNIKTYFAKTKIGEIAAAILKYLKGNPNASSAKIAEAVAIPETQVNEEISTLIVEGYIGPDAKLLPKANEAIGSEPGKQIVIKNMYGYDVLPGLGDQVIPGTRDFCRQLIEMDKLYTRQEIQEMSNEAGYSIWLYKGGWYHNPETDETTPYCRHDWFQHTIKSYR